MSDNMLKQSWLDELEIESLTPGQQEQCLQKWARCQNMHEKTAAAYKTENRNELAEYEEKIANVYAEGVSRFTEELAKRSGTGINKSEQT